MAEDRDESQQTEEPTAKRLEQARESGDLIKSQEIAAFALLALAIGPAPFAAQAALPQTTAVADPAAEVQIPVLE